MSRRVFCWFFIGSLLLQAAWIVSVPPFRGIDEIDHVYRAVSVADGQIEPSNGATVFGDGFLVRVPLSLVRAAAPICAITERGAGRCDPGAVQGDGRVLMTSTAARYNPAFYAVVGLAGRPFHGAAVVYAMRLAASVLCSLLFALAAMTLASWSRTRWPVVAFAVAMLPEVVYSSAVPGPNGIEMAGGAVVWAALLGLLARPDLPVRRLATVAAVGGVPLVFVRTLGPLWALMILVTIVLLGGAARTRELLRDRSARTALGTVVATAALGIAWSVTANTNGLGSPAPPVESLGRGLLRAVVFWPFQSIAAAPNQNLTQIPLVVFAVILAAAAVLFAAGVRGGGRRIAVTIGFIIVATNAVAIVTTAHAWDYGGMIWQGRYELPFAIGLVLVGGYGADIGRLPDRWAPVIVAVVALGAHVPAVISILHQQLTISPLSGSSEWFTLPAAVVGGLAAAGGLSWAIASMFSAPRSTPTQELTEPITPRTVAWR